MFNVKTLLLEVARILHSRLSATGIFPPWTERLILAPIKYAPYVLQIGILRNSLRYTCGNAIKCGDFDSLINRWVKVTVTDLGLSWGIGLTADREIQLAQIDNADTDIRGDAAAFVLIAARHADPDTLFFQRRITITGNTELGHEMKNLLDAAELSDLPLPAYKLLELVSRALVFLEKRHGNRL